MEDHIYEQLVKGVRKPKHKYALFLCGAAGSGKTTTRDVFLKDANLKTTYVLLSFDDIWSYMRNYKNASEVYEHIIERVISNGYSFLYDGTCRRSGMILRMMNSLIHKGYTVKLGIVYAPLKTILERVENRTYQPLNLEVAKEIYHHVETSIEKIMNSDIPSEVFLYDNTLQTKLIFHRTSKKVYCEAPNSNFYFDVSKYC